MINKAVILLVFANDVDDPLDAIGKECQALRKILRDGLDSHPHFHIELLPYSSSEDLFDELRRYSHEIVILHFAGHTDSELWRLHEGNVNAAGMAEVLALQDSIRFLFLNGCQNQQQVAAFAAANIPAVIATSDPVDDQQAQRFATEFYKKLVSKRALKTSLQESFDWAKATAAATDKKADNAQGKRSLRFDKSRGSWSWKLYESTVGAAQWSLADVTIQPLVSEHLSAKKVDALKKRWDRLTRKITLMQAQYDNETRVEELLRLEPLIDKVIADREAVERELSACQ